MDARPAAGAAGVRGAAPSQGPASTEVDGSSGSPDRFDSFEAELATFLRRQLWIAEAARRSSGSTPRSSRWSSRALTTGRPRRPGCAADRDRSHGSPQPGRIEMTEEQAARRPEHADVPDLRQQHVPARSEASSTAPWGLTAHRVTLLICDRCSVRARRSTTATRSSTSTSGRRDDGPCVHCRLARARSRTLGVRALTCSSAPSPEPPSRRPRLGRGSRQSRGRSPPGRRPAQAVGCRRGRAWPGRGRAPMLRRRHAARPRRGQRDGPERGRRAPVAIARRAAASAGSPIAQQLGTEHHLEMRRMPNGEADIRDADLEEAARRREGGVELVGEEIEAFGGNRGQQARSCRRSDAPAPHATRRPAGRAPGG